MPRVKIDLPEKFSFSTTIDIRITDLNYGGHVGNDTLLSLIHEARMRFLRHFDCTEMNFAGTGLIMSDAAIEFKSELFYGEQVKVSVAIAEISKVSFALCYLLEKSAGDKQLTVALARTGMVCFNYTTKKIAAFPESMRSVFNA
jgi:acyl-CoA thioesterase FadM